MGSAAAQHFQLPAARLFLSLPGDVQTKDLAETSLPAVPFQYTQLGEFAAWLLSQGVCALVGGWMQKLHATVIHLLYVKRKFDKKLCQEKSGKEWVRFCALRLECEQATSLVRQGSELQSSGNNCEHSASPIPKLLSNYFKTFLYGL